MPIRARRALAALIASVAAATLIAGCDPSNSEDERIEQAIADSYASLAAGDAAEFCPTLDPEWERDEFVERFGGPCSERTVEAILAGLTPEEREMVADPRIVGTRLDGDTAGTTTNDDFLRVNDIDGEWKLADLVLPNDGV